MKILKKILLLIGLILIFFVILILMNGHFFKNKKDLDNHSNINWMSMIKDDVKINNIVIPGSHDAGTYNMTYLGKTQGYSIKDQLTMGSRYFDLRVNKENDEYYLYHEYFNGEKFNEVLEDLQMFILTNTSEFLILDFQHFKGESEYDVIKFIEQYLVFYDLVIKNETEQSDLDFISNLELKDARGKCLILFGHHEEITDEYNYLFSRNNDNCSKNNQTLNSCYISDYHKMNSEKFIETAFPYYFKQIKEKIETEGQKGLFVLQGQLTDGCLIFGPYSREKTHNKKMSRYIEELFENEEYISLVNIIMRDFLTDEKCDEIIKLNYYKNNI